jgi:hypothetical protein
MIMSFKPFQRHDVSEQLQNLEVSKTNIEDIRETLTDAGFDEPIDGAFVRDNLVLGVDVIDDEADYDYKSNDLLYLFERAPDIVGLLGANSLSEYMDGVLSRERNNSSEMVFFDDQGSNTDPEVDEIEKWPVRAFFTAKGNA